MLSDLTVAGEDSSRSVALEKEGPSRIRSGCSASALSDEPVMLLEK